MVDLFAVTQLRQPTKIRFNRKAFAPTSFGAKLHILVRRVFLAKAKITQGDCLAIVCKRQIAKLTVADIGGVPLPSDYFALVVDQPTKLDTDNPAAV